MKFNEKVLISIAMLNYNGLEYLKKTIPSILTINYPCIEFILVDNGSTDGSIEYIKHFKEITLIENNKNLGYSEGKNICVEKCNGKYILLLDEDIQVIDNNSVQNILNIFIETNAKLLSILLIDKGEEYTPYYGGKWGIFGYSLRRKVKMEHFLKAQSGYHFSDSPEGGAIFFEKEYFKEIGGYRTSQPYFLDVGDLGLRSKKYSKKKTVVTNQIYFEHLGINRQRDVNKALWKYQYAVQGTLKILFYNFSVGRVILQLPFILIFFFISSSYKCFKFKTIKFMSIYLSSAYKSFTSVRTLLEERENECFYKR